MKKLLFTLCLAASSLSMSAQKGYDFAMVYSSDLKSVIYVIENEKEERLIPTTGKMPQQQEKLLRTISEMSLEGWEVISVTNSGTFYMRRPKK